MDPKGKVALVTGGARIGQVVAHSLAERGCDLALIYGEEVALRDDGRSDFGALMAKRSGLMR